METVFDKPLDKSVTAVADSTITNDILTDALATSTNKVFSGSGSAYTGSLPDVNLKWGIFRVYVNGSFRYVIGTGSNNYTYTIFHNGTAWTSWFTPYIGQGTPTPYTSQTTLANYQNTLLGYLEGMADGQTRIMETRSNWSGVTPTAGAWATTVLYRVESGVYKVNILDTCTSGYYYSSAWHWTRATMSSITFS